MFLRWFKKLIVPHKHNDHKPHILRTEFTLGILTLVLFVELGLVLYSLLFSVGGDFFASVLPSVLVDDTNQKRIQNSENVLKVNPVLAAAAQMKANDMAQKSYFSHYAPDGTTPWYWIEKAGYKYQYAGENLAVNFVDSSDVVEAWMDSPTHRENVLSSNYTEIGIATAKGNYEGRETIFVVQYFGSPMGFTSGSSKRVVIASPQGDSAKSSIRDEDIVVASAQFDPSLIANKTAPVPIQSQPVIIQAKKEANVIAKVMASPRRNIQYAYIVLLTVIGLSLALKSFIRTPVSHPALIINGVMMIILIGSAAAINQFVLAYQTQIF